MYNYLLIRLEQLILINIFNSCLKNSHLFSMKKSFDLILLYFHMCKRMVILRGIISFSVRFCYVLMCFSFGINYTLFFKFHFTYIIITLNLTRKPNFFNPNIIGCICVFFLVFYFVCSFFYLFAFICECFVWIKKFCNCSVSGLKKQLESNYCS